MVVGEVTTAVDVVVLGAGPSGYVGAIRATQLGKSVVVIDQHATPGGVCLNSGCIPLKALLAVSERYHQMTEAAILETMGIAVGSSRFDFAKMQDWKQGIVNRLTGGVKRLLKGHNIELVHGLGYFMSDHEVRVEGDYGSQRYSFEQCLLAVGAEPLALPDLACDGQNILTPSQALALTALPSALAIWGEDYISLELATLFARLGTAVTLLVPNERTLPTVEAVAVRLVMVGLRKLGIQIINDTGIPTRNATGQISYESSKNGPQILEEKIPLVICGAVQARTSQLNLAKVGLRLGEQGAIEVGPDQRTRTPYIFAAGDCTQHRPALATTAIKQAKVAAEALAGRKVAYAPQALPQVIHTTPEIATVGMITEVAQAAGFAIRSGRFALAANGRALTLGSDAGTAIIVAEAESETILGITIVGPRAGDLIGEAVLAIEMGATLTDLAETLHPHPGLGELLLESAESALGQIIHQLELNPVTR